MSSGNTLETPTTIIVPVTRTVDNHIDDFDALGVL